MNPQSAINIDINIDYNPLPKQHQFLTTDAHFAAFIAGVGSGKTLTGAHRGIRAAFGQFGNTSSPTPNTGMVCAPTYKMINRTVIPAYYEVLGGLVKEGGLIASYHKTDKVMTLINGSQIIFTSTDDPEHLRGPNLSWVHLDEAALMPEIVWKIMFGRIREHGNFGYMWLTSTPAGRNWLYQKWVQNKRPSYELTRMHTFDNIYLSVEYLLELAEEYGGDYAKQELGGAFVGFKGLIYPEFNPERHSFSEVDLNNYVYFVAGVDWGFASPGTILVAGVTSDGRVDILHEEYEKRRTIDDWASVAYQLHQTYNIQTFYCDPSKPNDIQKFIDIGCNAVGADNAVQSGIQDVRRLLTRSDEQKIPYLRLGNNTPWSQTEFSQYQWLVRNIKGEGEISLDVPKKAKDHTMDALRYLCRGISEPTDHFGFDVTTSKYA